MMTEAYVNELYSINKANHYFFRREVLFPTCRITQD